jgi:hypothetical protein
MSPDRPTAYEQLTSEEAAHIDSVCDRFERAWKETRAGGPVPRLASYLGHGHGSAREVLFGSWSRSTAPAGSATASPFSLKTPSNSARRPRPW